MGFITWLKREPRTIEKVVEVEKIVIDPQSELKTRVIDPTYLKLDELLRNPEYKKNEDMLVMAWLWGVDDLETFAKEAELRQPIPKRVETIGGFDLSSADKWQVAEVKDFLTVEAKTRPDVPTSGGRECVREYRFPHTPWDTAFPYDRSAARSQSAMLVPKRFSWKQQQVYDIYLHLKTLGVRAKLPKGYKEILVDQAKGMRRVRVENGHAVEDPPTWGERLKQWTKKAS